MVLKKVAHATNCNGKGLIVIAIFSFFFIWWEKGRNRIGSSSDVMLSLSSQLLK